MKILLINNHTVHLSALQRALAGHQVEAQIYRPGLQFHDEGKDLIILSGGGGEGLEINDYQPTGQLWHEDEMNFIRQTDKPVLGICMGFEVIARAFGAPVTPIGQLIQGPTSIQLSDDAAQLLGQKSLVQHESHRWRVEDLPADFKVLATSKTGIEMFRYKNYFAAQFHPEKGGSLQLPQLLAV